MLPRMIIRSELAGLTDADARRVLDGLPRAGSHDAVGGYDRIDERTAAR